MALTKEQIEILKKLGLIKTIKIAYASKHYKYHTIILN